MEQFEQWPNGVNPDAEKQWEEEDRNERIEAFSNLLTALFRVEQLYEVPSESEHPLEKAYALIYEFIESQGMQDDI